MVGPTPGPTKSIVNSDKNEGRTQIKYKMGPRFVFAAIYDSFGGSKGGSKNLLPGIVVNSDEKHTWVQKWVQAFFMMGQRYYFKVQFSSLIFKV